MNMYIPQSVELKRVDVVVFASKVRCPEDIFDMFQQQAAVAKGMLSRKPNPY